MIPTGQTFSLVRIRVGVCAFLLVLLISPEVLAQNFRGGINGTVADRSGAVVPDAKVTATNIATATHYSAISSSAGQFLFDDLPLGTYVIAVDHPGFQSVRVNNVPVVAGTVYPLKISLSPAQVTTTLEVNANQLTLETAEATVSTVLPTEAVQDVPMNGRDFTTLVGQLPGWAGYNITGGGGSGTVNGTRPNQINYQIEGTDNNDIWWNIAAVNQSAGSSIAGTILPMDAIDQFSFVASGGPEIGRNPGGTLNLAIKSGTNLLHGSAYYFNRNEFFAATSPFAPPGTKKNEERNENIGFSFGAPILKDKLFFFTAFEYQNYIIGNAANATEPSTAYQALANNVLSYYGVPVNPVSTNLLNNLWPAYALTGPAQPGNYFANAPLTGHSYNGILKFDYNINENNNLSVKGFIGQGSQISVDGSNLAEYYSVTPIHVQNYSVILNTVLSPHLTNQVSAGFNYFNENFSDVNTSANPVALGLNTGVTDPGLSGAPEMIIGGVSYSNAVFDVTGPQTQKGRTDIVGHINEAVAYTVGKHEFRFGGQFRRDDVDDRYNLNGRGVFGYTGAEGPWAFPTSGLTPCDALATKNLGKYAPGYSPSDKFDPRVLDLADFMAGCVASSDINIGNPFRVLFVNSFSLFAQDTWQVSRNLNLSYGLRYDYFGPIHNGDKNLVIFDPSVPSGLKVVQNLYQQWWKGFAPRLGFAYQPRDKGTVVVRGGFGLYFDQPNMIPFVSLRGLANGGAVGAGSSPAGADPVASATVSSYVIVPNQPIFPSLSEAIAGQGVISVFTVDPKFRPSVTANYNLNIQKSLGRSAIAQIGYVGTQSRHLVNVVDINQAAQGSAFHPPTCPPQYASAGAGNQQCSRPFFAQFPDFSVINKTESGVNANYNSLQALLKISAWHGLTSQFSYTFSHALDYMTGLIPYVPQDSTNLSAEYGNSDFDTRHSLVGYFTYDIPGSSHGPGWLSHGWQVNSGLIFRTGQPFTVTASTNASGNGEFSDRADAVPGVDPFAGLSHKIVNGVVQWFNPAAFRDAPNGQYGTTLRGQYRNPGFAEVDLSIFKNTRITERVTLQLRAEMFNIFNRINLGLVGAPGAVDSGGTISSTIGTFFATPGIGPGEPFNTQLAAKIIF